jgi:hypothetical protein
MHSTHTARPSTRGRPTTRPSMWEVTGPATGPQTVHTEIFPRLIQREATRSSAAVCASMAVSPLGPGMGRWPTARTRLKEPEGLVITPPRCHADGLARLSGTDGGGHNRDTAVALTPLSEHSCRGYSVDQTRHACARPPGARICLRAPLSRSACKPSPDGVKRHMQARIIHGSCRSAHKRESMSAIICEKPSPHLLFGWQSMHFMM